MSETLDFPPLIDPAELDRAEKHAQAQQPAVQQPLVTVAPAVPDLTKIDLTDVALAMYGTWRKDVDATKANLSTLVLDLSTPTKITEARSLRARLIATPLAEARKVSQGIKSKMAKTSKAVGAELEKIEAAYAEADALILPKIEAAEEEAKREREAKAKAEQERKDRHRANIESIRAFAVRADTEPGMTADRIATGIKMLQDTPTPTSETWEEFAVEAADAICQTLDRMWITYVRVLRAEQAEAEAAELRARLAAQSNDEDQAPRRGEHDAPAVERNATTPASSSPSTEYPKDGAQQVLKAEPATADATDRAPTSESPRVGAMGAGQAADAAPAGGRLYADEPLRDQPAGRAAGLRLDDIELVQPPAPADEKPTLKLGDINEWLAPIQLTAAGLVALGIEHSDTEKAAKLYKPSDKLRIKAALIAHIEGLA